MEELLNEIPSDIDEIDEENEWPDIQGFELNSSENSAKNIEKNIEASTVDEHLEISEKNPGKNPGTIDDDQDQMPLPDVSCDSCAKLFSISEISDHKIICSEKNYDNKNPKNSCKYCQIELKLPSFNPISAKRHLQQCKKYHSFITMGNVCKFCQKTQKSIGHLFNHLEKAHTNKVTNFQNSSKKIAMGSKKSSSSIFPCKLCNFNTKDGGGSYIKKYQLIEKHYMKQHFHEKIKSEVKPIMPKNQPFKCPAEKCDFEVNSGDSKHESISKRQVLMHYLRRHGILKKYINDALQVKGQQKTQIEISNGFVSCLPNTSVCVLCGEKPTKEDKDQAMFNHYCQKHFRNRIKSEVKPLMMPEKNRNSSCPDKECDFMCDPKTNQEYILLKHYLSEHGILKKFIEEEQNKDEVNDVTKFLNPPLGKKKTRGRKSVCPLPSTAKCKLCDFENKAPTNRNTAMISHYLDRHFKDKITNEIKPILPNKKPFKCPGLECDFVSKTKNNAGGRVQILLHYTKNHGIINRLIKEASKEDDKKQKDKNTSKHIEEDKNQKENNASKRIKRYCVNCNKQKKNQENFKFCIDCLNREVLTERQQHICRLCDKEFSTLDEAYQHIDSEHCQHYDTLTKDEGLLESENSTVQSLEKFSSPRKIRSTNNKRQRPEANAHDQNPKKRLKRKEPNLEPQLEQKQSPLDSRMTIKDSNPGNEKSISGNKDSSSGSKDSNTGNDDTTISSTDIISNHPESLKNELESDNNGGGNDENSTVEFVNVLLRNTFTKQEKMVEISSNNAIENSTEVTSTTKTTEISAGDDDNDDVVEIVDFKFKLPNIKSEQENAGKTTKIKNLKIKVLDEEQESCLNTNIQKPISQITLADVKNVIKINWRHFPIFMRHFRKSRKPPVLRNYSYSAKNEDEGGSWDLIENDFEILPSFQNIIEVKCILPPMEEDD